MAMPMLPPRLRIRLKIPVALPSCSSRSVATVSVASGANTSAVPKPLMTAGQITLLGATATLSPPNRALEYPTAVKPAAIRTRLSMMPIRRPAASMAAIDPKPRGLVTRPAWRAGYPRSV